MRSARPPQDRKFGCPKCEKKFFTPKDLRRHENTHLGLREHVCTSCHTRFGRKDHLTRHAKKSCSATRIAGHTTCASSSSNNSSSSNHNHNNNSSSHHLHNHLHLHQHLTSNSNSSNGNLNLSHNSASAKSKNHDHHNHNHLHHHELGRSQNNRNNHCDAQQQQVDSSSSASFAPLMPIAMSTQAAGADLRPALGAMAAAVASKPSFCEDKIVYYNHQYQYDALNSTSSSSYSSNYSPYGGGGAGSGGGGGASGATSAAGTAAGGELLQSHHHHQRSATQQQSTLLPTSGLQDQQYQINPTSPQQPDLFHVSANYANNFQCYYQAATDYGY